MRTSLFLILFFPVLSFSQSVVIEKIEECRSTTDSYFGNRCEIFLKIFGDEVRKNKFVRVNNIIKAVDDQGLNLIGEEKQTKYNEITGSNTSVSLNLMPTSRKAKVIKELSGEIALFTPTEANGGLVKIKNPVKSAMKDLLPKNKDLNVMLLTEESVEKFKKDQKNKKQAELKKQSKEVQEMANAIMGIFDEYFRWGDSKYEVSFMITGDQNKVVSIAYEKPDGTSITNNGYMSSNGLITYYFNEEIEPQYTLILNVESAGSVKKLPFSLKDVELP